MPTIEMSAGFVQPYVSRMFTLGTIISSSANGTSAVLATTSAATTGLLNSGDNQFGWSNTLFYIMKGTPPVDFSVITTMASRSADILMTFKTANLNAGDFLPTNVNVNPAIIQTNYVNASVTGTATWFWWTQQAYAYPTSNYPILQVMGTVGTIGSGADLEIPNVNIVSGTPYRVSNLRLSFPTTWTF